MSPRLVAQNPDGAGAALQLDASGFLKVVLSGGGGGGGDASAANQLTEIAGLQAINDNIIVSNGIAFTTQGNLVDMNTTNILFSAKFPNAAVPANNVAAPSVSKIQIIHSAIEPNSGNVYKIDVDTSRRLSVVSSIPNASTTSNSTAYQVQRTLAAFSCTMRAIEAFSTSAGFVVLLDKGTPAANGDFPKGGSVWPIAAGGRIEKEWFRGKNFTSGCVIALCTSVYPTITLAVSADAIFTGQLD